MANLVIPAATQPLGTCKCPNCGRDVKLMPDPIWYRFLIQVLNLINEGL